MVVGLAGIVSHCNTLQEHCSWWDFMWILEAILKYEPLHHQLGSTWWELDWNITVGLRCLLRAKIGIVNINITTGQLCSLREIYLLFKYKIYIHFQAKVEVKFNLELADVGGSINIYFEIHCSPSRMVIQLFWCSINESLNLTGLFQVKVNMWCISKF